MPKSTVQSKHALRFAYSTINWGTKPDLAIAFKDIRKADGRAGIIRPFT